MTIKNPDPALEKGAELFRTAFNREAPHKAALVRIDALESPLEAGTRWFRQIFTGSTSFELFAGVSSEAAGALPGELTELLEKVFRSMAASLGAAAASLVSCGTLGEEEAPPQGLAEIAYELTGESMNAGNLVLAVPQSAMSFMRAAANRPGARPTPHLDALLTVDLPVTISFGTTEMPLAEVLKLTAGSIVAFNHLLNEPVNVIVNDCLVARGDVVVIGGNYGVRISEVLARSSR